MGSELLHFYKKFCFAQIKSNNDIIVAFIEFSNHSDITYLRQLLNYWNGINSTKVVDFVYAGCNVRDIFCRLYGKSLSLSLNSESSSRGVFLYAVNYRVFVLFMDLISRLGFTFLIKEVICNNGTKGVITKPSDMFLSFGTEKLLTENTLKEYKLISLGALLFGGFFISSVLKHVSSV